MEKSDEIKAYVDLLNSDNPVVQDMLQHYGVPRRSGRYPWGSGEDPYQRLNRDFLARVEKLRKENPTYTDPTTGKTYTGDTAIAKIMGLSVAQFRTENAIAAASRRSLMVARARSLKQDGLSATEIAKKMGLPNESSVRSLLNEGSVDRLKVAKNTADLIKKRIDETGKYVEVGKGVERELSAAQGLNISKEKLDQAIYLLEREGYELKRARVPQATNPNQMTTITVLCPPGSPKNAAYDLDNITSLNDYISRDNGKTFEKKFNYPESMDSKRLMIRYAEDGGEARDGVIELRRGVPDLSLGESNYSQVRILVDGTHYLKGMAVYSDNMPDGVDVIFNTNKHTGTPALGDSESVLKKIKSDPDNPFGSAIKDADQGGQYWYDSKTGKKWDPENPVGEKKLGLINKRSDQGDWTDWKDALPSQFLSKQSETLAKQQMKLALADKADEYDSILSIDNGTVKKYFLNKFADECDSAAVHLKAAALPGQKYHVIMPINSLKDTEVFAPQYENGTKLALIRYPHGGTFEIPVLTVNNKNKDGKELIGKNSIDAVGITKKIADQLSGADFDGDTVMCIPTDDPKGKVRISRRPPLEGLEGFNPTESYGPDTYKGKKVSLMSKTYTQKQMGVISNLITDMTLQGASPDELAAAVRHSMVVIDAEKHKLNYKQSEVDNNIKALKEKYQAHVGPDGKVTYGGASTLISRAKGEYSVDKRQGSPKVNIKGTPDYDPERPEGALIWKTAPGTNLFYETSKVSKRTGEVVTETKVRKTKSTRMAETDDARTLISSADTPMERAYAQYANNLKAMANRARKEAYFTSEVELDPVSRKTYASEVSSLMAKLNTAELNRPRERMANIKAAAEVNAKKKAYKAETGEKMSKKDSKKLSQQAITKYRQEVDSVARRKRNIEITDSEWKAIQSGAISKSRLKMILDNTDIDALRERISPRNNGTLSQAKINKILAMSNSNYSLAEIAKGVGVSPATVSKYLKGAG